MISLASFLTHSPAPAEPGSAAAAGTEPAAPADGFSALLAALAGAPMPASAGDQADPLASLPGIALPQTAGDGKTLPAGLPPETADLPQDEPNAAQADAALLLAGLALTAPVPAAAPGSGGESAARHAPALPHPQMPAAMAPAPQGPRDAAPAAGPSVAVHVAAPAATAEGRDAAGQGPGEERSADPAPARFRRAAAEAVAAGPAREPSAPSPAPTSTGTAPAAASAAPAASHVALPPAGAPAEAAHDLFQIVDRLAAAREALAPATAALAIEHADFGELSLRFDQRGDGHLSVEIEAASPEAQRAIAAAVGQQSLSSGSEGSASSHTGTSAQARDTSAQREGEPGREPAERQGKPNRSGAAQGSGTDTEDRPRAGIFA